MGQIKTSFLAFFSQSIYTLDNAMTRTCAITTLLVILCVALLSEAIIKYGPPLYPQY